MTATTMTTAAPFKTARGTISSVRWCIRRARNVARRAQNNPMLRVQPVTVALELARAEEILDCTDLLTVRVLVALHEELFAARMELLAA